MSSFNIDAYLKEKNILCVLKNLCNKFENESVFFLDIYHIDMTVVNDM